MHVVIEEMVKKCNAVHKVLYFCELQHSLYSNLLVCVTCTPSVYNGGCATRWHVSHLQIPRPNCRKFQQLVMQNLKEDVSGKCSTRLQKRKEVT